MFKAVSFILLMCLIALVEGQVRVVGPSEAVTAHVGDAVVLPCRSDPPVDLTPITVEWSRTELRPHPSDRQKRVRFIHVYINHNDDDLDMKNPAFVNRTQLFPDQLAAGVASLRIQNVTLSDNGTYKCFIPTLPTNKTLRFTHVTLVVEAALAPTYAPDLNPKQEDSCPAVDSDSPTDRTVSQQPSIGCILLYVFFFMAVIIILCKASETELMADSAQESLQNESADPLAVRVEVLNLLFPPRNRSLPQVNNAGG